ncbi:hypothetical protein N431DRAFT_481144 [Stipitochalara longipes BDJ]|nr:hypothetical protein N431DRAFT_481144 [Stipitochalara longipes BDJ]
MEYLGFDYDSEQFNLTDLSLSLNIPTLDECFMTGTDQSLSPTISFSPFSPDGGESSNSRRSASKAGLRNSPPEGDILQSSSENWEDLWTSKRQSGLGETRDEIRSPHFLRRRIQNRNAQRSYRQRREDERKILLDKLKVAQEECRNLGETCTELQALVETLQDQLKRMEAENIALRTSISSMLWRQSGEGSVDWY